MTPHNTAEKGQIASTCLMPGDPLRAKMIAENFLTDVECFNQTRGMLGYTGTYHGKRVSVMGHGMGIPSAFTLTSCSPFMTWRISSASVPSAVWTRP